MNIYIGNLAFTASEDDVRQLFESYGAVDTVHLITDRETGRARGFGFAQNGRRPGSAVGDSGTQWQRPQWPGAHRQRGQAAGAPPRESAPVVNSQSRCGHLYPHSQ